MINLFLEKKICYNYDIQYKRKFDQNVIIKDHNKALVTNDILQNHSIIHYWCTNSRNPGEEFSHFQFYWGLSNNFKKLKKNY